MRRGHRLRVITDAIRNVDEATARMFLDEIGKSGGTLVTLGELIAELSRQPAA
jgi:hypothetical protein